MSTMNIAIVGGVVLLLLVLVKMRRDAAHDSPSPATGRGRSERRSRRRGKGRNAPPAPPEPMPLAAAGQSAAPSAEYDAPAAAEWPPAPEPSPAAWPPVEDEPVAAEPAHDPVFADAPADEAPVAESPVAEFPSDDVAVAWPDDELVTEPGWPMPGEVDDLAWTGSGPDAMPAAPPAASQPVAAWAEQAATAAPPSVDLEWMSTEPAADEPEPEAWTAPAEPVDESPWPAEAPEEVAGIPAWEPQIEAVDEIPDDGWPTHDEGVADARLADDVPVVTVSEEPVASVDDMPADPFAEVDEFAFGDVDGGYATSDVPEIAFAPEPEAAADAAPEPGAAAEPEIEFSFAPEEAPPAVPAYEAVVVPAPEVDAPAPADVAWWDEEPEPVAAAPEDPAPDDPALTGRFALGGFALQAGQHALGGVSFRSGLAEAPVAWAVAPTDGAAPGTLVLTLEGAVNCAPEGLEVVTDEGFAPTTEGFTVRVAATTAGPFAASGTFRVR